MAKPSAFDTLVIGGGVVGLATAWHLAREGRTGVALVERFQPGHDRGSSHGFSRITRSSYGHPLYVRLMQLAHAEEWPRLERAAGRPLIHRTDGVFFGPAGGTFEEHATAVASVGADVERIDAAEARRRFPIFRFPDAAGALHDRTAGLVAAADTVEALAKQCVVEGVHRLDHTRVEAIERGGDRIEVVTDRGRLLAERIVVTAGSWAAQLLPELAERLTVRRQSVGYFRLDAPAEALRPGRFPVWIYLGRDANDSRYGLPEFGREGVKAALHEVAGPSQDPDERPGPDPATLDRIREFLEAQLAVRVVACVHAETCLYTSTANEDYILDVLPGDPRIVVGSACSGHGFKFAPLTGRLLAELVTKGRTSVPAFEEHRAMFAL